MTMGQVSKGRFLQRDAIIARIETVRKQIPVPTLCDVISAYPPSYGTEELAAYLWIAGSEIPSLYQPGRLFDAVISAGDRRVVVRCPNPSFPATGTPGEGLEGFLALTRFAGIGELLREIPWTKPRAVEVVAAPSLLEAAE